MITFALSKWKEGEVYNVAYIPHVPTEIRQGKQIHKVIPTRWDLEQVPKASNLYMDGGNNKFRLNGKYPKPEFVGSKKNVDLSPNDDKDAILELLKLAEKIYDSPE